MQRSSVHKKQAGVSCMELVYYMKVYMYAAEIETLSCNSYHHSAIFLIWHPLLLVYYRLRMQ